MLKKLSKLIVLLTLIVCSASGQVNETENVFVCQEIEVGITQAIEISEIKRRVSYEDECRLSVESGKDWFSISVAKYETEAESEKEFNFDFGLYLLAESDSDKYTKHLERNNFWGGAKGYYKSTKSDQVVMLRYKKIVFTLIGSDYELLLNLEKILRKIPFDSK